MAYISEHFIKPNFIQRTILGKKEIMRYGVELDQMDIALSCDHNDPKVRNSIVDLAARKFGTNDEAKIAAKDLNMRSQHIKDDVYNGSDYNPDKLTLG